MARFSNVLRLAAYLAAVMITVRADVTVGREFYLAFPCNGPNYASSVVVINSNTNPAAVTIDSSLHDFVTIQRTVPANSAMQIDFMDPHVVLAMQVCDTNVKSQQGFRVITNIDVSLYVYQTMPGGVNSAEYLVLPANMLGTQYFGGYNQRYLGIIVARQDGTQINVGGNVMTLNRLDVYYATATTPVSSNYPFALIFTTQSQINVTPFTSVMALPVSYAATQSSIAPDVYGNPPAIQIWATTNNTQVSVNGGSYTILNYGTPMETTLNGGGTVTATNPVQVFTWGPSLQYAFYPDVFLMSNVQFFTSNGNNGTAQLMIVTPIDSTGNIQVDGTAVPALQYRRIPYSTYYFYVQPVATAGLHTIQITTLDDRYLAYIYYPYASNIYSTSYIVAMNLPKTS